MFYFTSITEQSHLLFPSKILVLQTWKELRTQRSDLIQSLYVATLQPLVTAVDLGEKRKFSNINPSAIAVTTAMISLQV